MDLSCYEVNILVRVAEPQRTAYLRLLRIKFAKMQMTVSETPAGRDLRTLFATHTMQSGRFAIFGHEPYQKYKLISNL